MDARVKAHIWVSMAIRMSDMAGRPAAVLRKGDASLQDIATELRKLDNRQETSSTQDN